VTLEAHMTWDKVSTKHISNEISLSDHRYILFQVSVLEISRVTYCNPPTTNWEFY